MTCGLWRSSGGNAPGTTTTFRRFLPAVINSKGQVAFRASLTRSPATVDDSGIWSEGGGPLTLIADRGQLAPGSTERFGNFTLGTGKVALSSSGQTAFNGIVGTGSTFSGIWSKELGKPLTLVAGYGNNAPGTGNVFSSFNDDIHDPIINETGQLAFRAAVIAQPQPFTLADGIWRSSVNGQVGLVDIEGNNAPWHE